jgi:hypothetical protein
MVVVIMVVAAMVIMVPMTVVASSATARENTPGSGEQRDSANYQQNDSHS